MNQEHRMFIKAYGVSYRANAYDNFKIISSIEKRVSTLFSPAIIC